MEFKDYYATMGVEPNADLKTIKTAYRRLARKYHPDVSTEEDAESKFKELAEAYEVLKDEERRAGDDVQKLTDKFIGEIEKALEAKEADLMAV